MLLIYKKTGIAACFFYGDMGIYSETGNTKPSPYGKGTVCCYTALSAILVEDDEGGDHTGNPSGKGEQENDEYRTASFVYYGKRREKYR